VASTQRYHKGDLLPIHPGCDCGEMPLYGTDDPGQIINQQRLDATHEAVEARFGEFDRSAREIDYRNIMVADHGEMGPVLTWKKHNSVKLAGLGKPTVAGEVVDSVIDQTPITTIMRRLKEEELIALRGYTQDEYMTMNSFLRQGRDPESFTALASEDLVERVEALEGAFEASRLKERTTLYRGSGLDTFGIRANFDEQFDVMVALKGQTLVEPAFTSTSSGTSGVFTKRFLFEIDAPEGTPALDVNGISDLDYVRRNVGIRGEEEVLLPPGTRFRIDDVERRSEIIVVKATIVREGE
jgi:hypothetical protein